MANIKSQKKRIRTNEAARMRNKAVKSELKTLTKHVQSAVAEGDAEKAQAALKTVTKRLDMAAAKHVIHKNQASNRKSGLAKLVNSIMLDGKKGVAQKVVYGAFDIIKEKTEKEPLEVFTQAMENIMPSLEVKARRVGGANYQVPMEVRPARRQTLGLRWLTAYARARGERTMAERLAGEIMDAANNSGSAVKKREDTHKMAESNKAFAHFRW